MPFRFQRRITFANLLQRSNNSLALCCNKLLHRKRSPGLSLFSKREYGKAGRELFVGAGSARPRKHYSIVILSKEFQKNRCGEEILRFAQNDRTTEPVMLERSEASNTRTCHPERVKRRGISINTKEEIPHTWFGMTEPQRAARPVNV